MSIRKWETCKMHPNSNSGGSLGSEHTESGGKSSLVSVKHFEKGSLTSECGYSPVRKTLWESTACKKPFLVY